MEKVIKFFFDNGGGIFSGIGTAAVGWIGMILIAIIGAIFGKKIKDNPKVKVIINKIQKINVLFNFGDIKQESNGNDKNAK